MTLCSSHTFWSESETEVVNVKITINSRSKTPCNTVNSYIKQCHWQNIPLKDSLFLFVEIRKCWSDLDKKKFFMKFGNLPRSPKLWRSSLFRTSKWSHKPSPDQRKLLLDVSGYWPLLWKFPIWPQVQRDPGLASEGVLRLCTILSLAPLLPRPEPAGLLCLVIRREHHQHYLPQYQSQPDCRNPPSIRRAPASTCERHAPSSGYISRQWLRLKVATLNRCQLYYIIKLPELIFSIKVLK